MKARWLLFILCCATAFAGCNTLDIPLIGLDENKNPIEVLVAKPEYAKRVGLALSAAQDSAMPALNRRVLFGNWGLRTVVIGLGVSGEIGLGPFKVGAIPRFRVAFTNSTDPSLP